MLSLRDGDDKCATTRAAAAKSHDAIPLSSRF
jgi:hypothetical protein